MESFFTEELFQVYLSSCSISQWLTALFCGTRMLEFNRLAWNSLYIIFLYLVAVLLSIPIREIISISHSIIPQLSKA